MITTGMRRGTKSWPASLPLVWPTPRWRGVEVCRAAARKHLPARRKREIHVGKSTGNISASTLAKGSFVGHFQSPAPPRTATCDEICCPSPRPKWLLRRDLGCFGQAPGPHSPRGWRIASSCVLDTVMTTSKNPLPRWLFHLVTIVDVAFFGAPIPRRQPESDMPDDDDDLYGVGTGSESIERTSPESC